MTKVTICIIFTRSLCHLHNNIPKYKNSESLIKKNDEIFSVYVFCHKTIIYGPIYLNFGLEIVKLYE